MPGETATLGAAGEHYVLFQLLRRGFIAALAPHGVPMADIIVTDDVGKRLCAVQVKTRRAIGSDGGWHMKDKHEELKSSSVFYCFVDVGKSHDDTRSCYVVPSTVVARVLLVSRQYWLATPGAKGHAWSDFHVWLVLEDGRRGVARQIEMHIERDPQTLESYLAVALIGHAPLSAPER